MKKSLSFILMVLLAAGGLFAEDIISKPTGTKLRIASWNVYRTRIFNGERHDSFQRLHNALQPDIWFLNEMFYSGEITPETEAQAFIAHVRSFTGEPEWTYSWDAQGRFLLTRYPVVWEKELRLRVYATWVDLPSSVSDKDLLAINVHLFGSQEDQAKTAREFIRQVRDGTYTEMAIPQDINIVLAGDFNSNKGGATYQVLTEDVLSPAKFEKLIDPEPSHVGNVNGVIENTIGNAILSGSQLQSVSGGIIDFILYNSSVLGCAKTFIPDTLVMDQALLDSYGLQRGDIAMNPDDPHDYVNGTISCDHFPQIADFYVPPNLAGFVSQNVPAGMDPGQIVQVSITMKNTGSNTWSTANGHKLGIHPDCATAWSGTRISLPNDVSPGQNVTFTFDITAPTQTGQYDLQYQMIDEAGDNTGWFNSPTPLTPIAVGPQESHIEAEDFTVNSGFSFQPTEDVDGELNTSMTDVGDYLTYDVNMHSGTYNVYFRYAAVKTMQFDFKLGDTLLTSVSLPSTTGYQIWATSSAYPVTLPTGSNSLKIQATDNGWNLNWFELVPVVGNNAEFVSQSVPSSMETNQVQSVQIVMKNTGTDTWSTAGGHKLGSQNPQDNTIWTGANRVALPQSTAPNANATFSFDITAPSTPGIYNFQWKMVDDAAPNAGWFGDAAPSVAVNVGNLYDITSEPGTLTHNAVDSPPTETAPNAIDDNVNTKFLSVSQSVYLQYQLSDPQDPVVAYTLTSANDVPERDPIDVVLKGSQDGSNWTTLDTQTGIVYSSRFETVGFNISNSTVYEYYRLEMSNDGDVRIQVAEIELLAPGQSVPTVPNVVGLSESVAGAAIVNAGYVVGTVSQASNGSVPVGDVISQNPVGGTAATPGSSVDLVVSTGPTAGTVILAVDFHQNTTDPIPTDPDYFVGWFVGNVSAGVAAPSTNINGYGVTLGSGTSIDCLTTPALMTGMNARNRSAGYILNAGDFTQEDMMRERLASLGAPTDPATGNGTGNGLYLKVTGLSANTEYVIQAWGVDSTGAFTNPPVTLKNGYNYGFDATSEPGGYTSLPQLGTYTVAGSPMTIADNDEYSVSGTITTDSGGTLIYKQISSIDKSLINGFTLTTVAVTTVSVPDVVGQTQSAAESAITSAGLTVGNVTTANSESVPAGSVISQNPTSGTQVAPGASVDLVVSLGPALEGYDAWAVAEGVGAATEDDDGDGINNLLEYATDGDPNSAGDDIDPVLTEITDAFEYTYDKRNDDPNLDYMVETCSDLTANNWSDSGTVPSVNGTVGAYDNVTHTIPADQAQSYIRLKITNQ